MQISEGKLRIIKFSIFSASSKYTYKRLQDAICKLSNVADDKSDKLNCEIVFYSYRV